jgi:hypothetical protein
MITSRLLVNLDLPEEEMHISPPSSRRTPKKPRSVEIAALIAPARPGAPTIALALILTILRPIFGAQNGAPTIALDLILRPIFGALGIAIGRAVLGATQPDACAPAARAAAAPF